VAPSLPTRSSLPTAIVVLALALGIGAVVLSALTFTHQGAPSTSSTALSPSTHVIVVPAVVGMRWGAAVEALQSVGLQVSSEAKPSTVVPIGQVAAQAPSAGAHMPQGGMVTIVQSVGPNP